MAIKYYGRTSTASTHNGASVGAVQNYVKLGPITATGPLTKSAVYGRYSDAVTPCDIRMSLYELATPEANSTLVGYVTKPIVASTDPQWFEFTTEWAGTTLEVGKTYLVGVSLSSWGSNSDRALPFYIDGGTFGHSQTTSTGAPAWPDPRDPIGATSSVWPAREPSIYLAVEESPSVVEITNVNTNNVVTHLGGIVINGTFPSGTYSADIDGHALTVESVTDTVVECSSLNFFNTQLEFGKVYSLTVDDGTSSDSIDITTAISADGQYATISNLFADGIMKDVPGVADGQQVALSKVIAGATVTLYADTDVLFSPALPNGTVSTRYWHNGTSWDQGPFTVNQGAVQDIDWVGDPNPSDGIVSVPYNYSLKPFIAGDRPVTITLATGVLPNGLSIDSTSEAIVGTPAQSGVFPSIIFTADNGSTANSRPCSLTVNSATLTGLTVSSIAQETASVSITNNVSSGTLTFAIRTTGPYGPNDVNSVKTGPALWRDTQSPPIAGVNTKTAVGLSVATKHYVGVVYSYGTHDGLVSTAEFTTLAYPVVPTKPTQCSPYPNLTNYRDVPVIHNLLYGWGGDNPKTATINKLPSGLVMDQEGVVTGTPDSQGTTSGIIVTVSNPAGSTQAASFNWFIDRMEEVQPPTPEYPSMDRKGLLDLIKVYADRFDTEVINALPTLLKVAESRLSRMMRVREMSDTYTTEIVDGRDYYTLPADFAGMRNIQVKYDNGPTITPKYVNPEQGNAPTTRQYYMIITNRLRMSPPLYGTGVIELAYYQRVAPLVNDTDTTWLLQKNPDTYVCALMAEVEAFVKNDERSAMWIAKLDKAFDEINYRDQDDRWSGNPLTINLEQL